MMIQGYDDFPCFPYKIGKEVGHVDNEIPGCVLFHQLETMGCPDMVETKVTFKTLDYFRDKLNHL